MLAQAGDETFTACVGNGREPTQVGDHQGRRERMADAAPHLAPEHALAGIGPEIGAENADGDVEERDAVGRERDGGHQRRQERGLPVREPARAIGRDRHRHARQGGRPAAAEGHEMGQVVGGPATSKIDEQVVLDTLVRPLEPPAARADVVAQHAAERRRVELGRIALMRDVVLVDADLA